MRFSRWAPVMLVVGTLLATGCSSSSPLMNASREGDAQALESTLRDPDRRVDLEERDDEGRTALMVAILEGPEDLALGEIPGAVGVLLTYGADVNARNPETGLTPLRCAIGKSYPAVVWALLNRGAQVEERDLTLARERFDYLLEYYAEHYDWLRSKTGLTDIPVMDLVMRRIRRAERVINHLGGSPSRDPRWRIPDGAPQEEKPKQLQDPVALVGP